MVVVAGCSSFWVVVWSFWPVVGCCGSLWVVVGRLWVVVGRLWVVVGRCGSLWVVHVLVITERYYYLWQ